MKLHGSSAATSWSTKTAALLACLLLLACQDRTPEPVVPASGMKGRTVLSAERTLPLADQPGGAVVDSLAAALPARVLEERGEASGRMWLRVEQADRQGWIPADMVQEVKTQEGRIETH